MGHNLVTFFALIGLSGTRRTRLLQKLGCNHAVLACTVERLGSSGREFT